MQGHKDMPQTPGIYGIYSEVNDTIYVGSSLNMRRRTKQHKTDLKCNRHPNTHLQRAYNLYGVDEFQFVILELTDIADKDHVHALEQKWLDYCTSNYKGVYNGRPIAESTRGYHHTEDAKEKIRQNSKKYMNRPEVKERYSALTKERMSNPEEMQKHLDRITKVWNVTLYDPEGNPHFVEKNLKQFCLDNGLFFSNICRVLKGEQPHHKGWRIDPTFDYKTNHASAITYDVVVISPDGEVYGPITNVKMFCENHNLLDPGKFAKMLRGKAKQYKGWRLQERGN